ncbi:hypothetical protein RIF29_36906 [Crotalaria pallida]|uniref:AT-hook motif nuclear-localized protein n=1 Tax=Crotalaria pallida TaxID=3830 RepID=A0AAN9EBT2_CROPI
MDSRDPTKQPNVMMGPNSSSYPTIIPPSSLITPATARFPFSSMPHHPSSAEPFNTNTSTNTNTNTVNLYDDASESKSSLLVSPDSAKKKRGRPRKISPDGNIALGLAPAATPQPVASPPGSGATELPSKKHRGRPPSSGKMQLDALGAGGTGFTAHVIVVEAGEDVAAKILAFSQQGPRIVCILSANGPINSVTLRQPAVSGSTITYEVIVGSFIAEGKKSSSDKLKSGSSVTSSQMLTFGVPATPTSPTSQGPSSESDDDDDDDDDDAPAADDDSGTFNRGPGLYNNTTQPVHNMPMYHHHLWAGQSHQ